MTGSRFIKPVKEIENEESRARRGPLWRIWSCRYLYSTMKGCQHAMDWKSEAIEKLRNYETHKRSLVSIPMELERMDDAYTGLRAATLDGTARGGGNHREDIMLSNIVRRDDLKRRLEESRLWVEFVDGGLSVLDDEERLVLERFYIHPFKGKVDELCERLNVEQATVYRKRDSALRRFTLALYGALESP